MSLRDRVWEFFNRRWQFGPPTKEMTSTVQVVTAFDPGMFGCSLRWVWDDGGRTVNLMLGPVEVMVMGPPVEEPVEVAVDVGGRQLQAFWCPQHIGALARWSLSHGMAEVRVGPIGLHLSSGPG